MPDGMSGVSENHGRTFSLYCFLSLLAFFWFSIVCGLDLSWGSVNLDRFRTIPFILFSIWSALATSYFAFGLCSFPSV